MTRTRTALLGFLGGALVVGAFWFATASDSERSLKIAVGDASIEMDASGMEIQHENVLQAMWDDSFAQAGLLDWLYGKDVLRALDHRLIEKFCDPLPEGSREERLRAGRECADKRVVAELRDLSERRRLPFHYIGEVVTIGTPEDPPPKGRAFACRDGVFWREKVRLTNLQHSNRQVLVEARGHYPCTDPSAPKIQIGLEDAAALFGGPTNKIERAEAIIVE